MESSQIEGQITIPEINIKSCPRFKLNNIVIHTVLNAIKIKLSVNSTVTKAFNHQLKYKKKTIKFNDRRDSAAR